MNRKFAMIGLSIAVGSVMLITTAFASTTGTSGYDTYKSAIKNMLTAKNFTESATITANDNGKVIATVSNSSKLNLEKEAMSQSTTIKAGDQTKTMESFRQDGKTITKNSDSNVYNVMSSGPSKDFNGKKAESKKIDPAKIKDGEMLVDALVGNLQNYVTLDTKADGTKDVAIQLSDSQIPAVANTAASIFIKNAAEKEDKMGHEKEFSAFKNDITANMPKLVEDIRVNNVSVKAEINKDNYIVNQVADIAISGKDANGVVHNITVDVNMDVSNINNTTPDKIDLTGKQTKTITNKKGEFRHQGEDQTATQDNEAD